ncbi:MAG: YvrJ family protein [Acidaminococcaceae bacterium]|nr:YvrJ family protein [Acidaminococcaceae bacterium]
MDNSYLATQIANYGFPMVLSWFLLVRMETKLEKLTVGINELRDSISKLNK